MKTIQRSFSIAFFLFVFTSISLAQSISLTQSNESGIYKTDDEIKVTAYLEEI